MSFLRTLPFAASLLVLPAQSTSGTPSPTTVPLYRVTVVQGAAQAINYRNLKHPTKIDLKGTALAPNASGQAEVESRHGGIQIGATFKHLPAASDFGSEFLTYVLWGISPEGRATNLGELRLRDGKSTVVVSEQLQSFGLVVTAEPYFAVSQPSDAVILENVVSRNSAPHVEFVDAKFELLKRGQYTVNLPAAPVPDGKTSFDLHQAHHAVRIAQASGARAYAPEAFGKAEGILTKAEGHEGTRKGRVLLAREAIQRAEDARLIAVQRQAAEQETLEKKWAQDNLDEAKRKTDAATAAQNAALAQTQETEAKNEVLRSRNEGLRDKNEGLEIRNEGLRARLQDQLNTVLQTRVTARGLIVNMSGVLFQFGKADLLPPAREKLAKIAGILMTHKGLRIEAEGFTDSIGGDEFNLRLSEKRAEAARDYLVSQGVMSASITSKGFGKADPIASNETDAGRQENRRVELVVSGEGLTAPKGAGL